MEKEFMQINDSELEAVAGGLDVMQREMLFRCTTAEVATVYLHTRGINSGTAAYDEYMKLWKMKHDR